jgi:pimeloyl-ACP methyl ester carboxylesterase
MGAAIALTMALRSQAFSGLVLMGAGASLPVHPELLQLTRSWDTFPTAVERVVRGSFSRSAEPGFVDLARQRIMSADPSVFHNDFVACSHFDVAAQLGQIDLPALVMCGAEDRMTRPEQNESLAAGLPRAEFWLVPDAGHMVMLEKPEAVAEKMAQFLAERVV